MLSKLPSEADSHEWVPTCSGRNPLLEAFWLDLLALSCDSEFSQAAEALIIAAARQSVSLASTCQALATLFSTGRSLYAAAGIFSELAWQVQDRRFLQEIVRHLQEIQVCIL